MLLANGICCLTTELQVIKTLGIACMQRLHTTQPLRSTLKLLPAWGVCSLPVLSCTHSSESMVLSSKSGFMLSVKPVCGWSRCVCPVDCISPSQVKVGGTIAVVIEDRL